MTYIHSYTERSGSPYPGFVNLSEQHTDTDSVKNVLTVRQQGHHGLKQASIVLSDDEMLKLSADILEHLNAKARQA
jgi:hypothetical protein